MKLRCCLFFLAALLCPAVLAGPKTPKAATLPPGHRFLFVIETSVAAARYGYATRQALVDMIWSGLDGQIRQGDTYGLWTYNEEPRTGIFPMQTWTNTISLDLASQAGRFLRDQPYANRLRLDRLVEKLQTVIQVVKDVDIIMISGGDGPISNTPFDQQINGAWRDKLFEAREAKKPLVTTLSARHGAITAWSVVLAGERIRLGERPGPPVAAPAAVPNASPKRAGATSSPPVSIEKPRAAAPPSELLVSNTVAAAVTSTVAQASVANATPAPIAESTPPLAVPNAASPPTPTPLETPTNAALAPVVYKLSTTAPQSAPGPLAAPPSPVNSEPSSESSTRESLTATADNASSSFPPPAPMVVAAREPSAVTRPTAPQREIATELAVVAPHSLFNPVTMALIGSALLLSTLVLILLFVRRSAPIPQPSFITQSIERGRSADTLSVR
jgi:hypothetical protein